MKLNELEDFDPARFLKSEESIRHFLAEAFADNDPGAIQAALGVVARARGMTTLARESGVRREALYRALSQTGNAEFATILKVVGSLGLRLTVTEPSNADEATPVPKRAAVKAAPAPRAGRVAEADAPIQKRARPRSKPADAAAR
nr:addiction module antidote protein [Burkholderia gladioli]